MREGNIFSRVCLLASVGKLAVSIRLKCFLVYCVRVLFKPTFLFAEHPLIRKPTTRDIQNLELE